MNNPSPKSNHQAGIPAPLADPGHKPQVALVRGLSEGSFMERYLLGAQAMAAELGIRLTAFNADGDPAAMAALIEQAVQDGVDAIVINHGQTDVLQPAVEAALEQGVPVVTFDLVIDHPDVPEIEQDDMLIGFNLAKKLVADCAGRANVIYVNAEGFAPLEKRDRAWQDFKWRYPGLKELAHLGPVTQQTAADTGEHLQTLLQEQPDTTAVLAMWDEFAKGAMQAITQADLSHQVRLYSVDITDEDIRLMTEPGSPWVATVATDAYNIGRLALRTATALIAGEKVDKYLLVEPQLITQEFLVNNRIANMDDLIQVLLTLGESRLVWFDWMEPLLARNGYQIPAATLAPEQLLEQFQTTLTSLQWRNVELQTAAEVSRAASSILDPDKLLQEVVDLTKARFDLYHAHLYLLNKAGTVLNLAAGAGKVGRQMVAEGWSIPLEREQSLVARAARTRHGVIINDVQAESDYLPNPLLPDTRSEMAVPMIVGGRVLGVLDVQADVVDRFTEEDVRIQTTLAAQIGVALENADQYERTRTALSEAEQSQTLLRSIIDATPDWIFVKDQEHRYRLANQGYAHALHLSPEDFIGKNDLELGFPEELVKGDPEKGIRGFWADDRLVMDSGETQVYPDDPATIDGELHTFHTIKTPLRHTDGQVWGVLAFARDITERKQAEDALRRERALLNSLIDSVPDLIFYKDQEGVYLGCNTAFEAFVGRSEEELVNKTDFDLFPTDVAEFFREQDQLMMAQKQTRRNEEWVDYPDGRRVLLDTLKTPFYNADGEVIGLIGISRDITERKLAEAERERLLAEVEASYRQYIQQEWAQFLGEQHRGRWRIEYQRAGFPTEPGGNGDSQAIIEAPLVLRGQQIGALRLEDLDPGRKWTDEEKALVAAVSEQLAQTVENLRLFENTQQRATREQLTRQIADKMRAAPDVDSIIETGLSELAKALGVSRTYVKLRSEIEPAAETSKIQAIREQLKQNGHKAISATGSASRREEADNSEQVEEI